MTEDSLKKILEEISQSEFLKKKFDKKIKSTDEAQKVIGECKNIETYLNAVKGKISEIGSNIRADASFFLSKTNFHIESPENYMRVLDYFSISTKKRKIENINSLEKDFQELVKSFRKKNYSDRETLGKYLEYTCLGSRQQIKIDATCGDVSPRSSQHYDLQRVSLDIFLAQFETFKKAEKELFEMLDDYKEKIPFMTTLSAKCINKYDGDWDKLIIEERNKKEDKKIHKTTEQLNEDIVLCQNMKIFENKYDVKMQLMFQAYSEYLEPKKN